MITSSTPADISRGGPPRIPIDTGLRIVLGVGCLLLLLLLICPFAYDDCIYESMARDYLRYGRLPYLGSWDNNFPGIIPIHVLALSLFGISDLSIRLLDYFLQLGCAALLYRLFGRWLRWEAAALAAVLYLCYYISSQGDLYSQRDVYLTFAVLGSFHLLLGKHSKEQWRIAWSGLLIGYAVLMRPTSLAFVAIGAAFVFLQERQQGMPSSRGIRSVLAFGFCGLFPLMAFLAYYATVPHGLEAFYNATIRFNLDVYTRFTVPLKYFLYQCTRKWLFLPFAFLGGVMVVRGRAKPWTVRPFFWHEAALYLTLLVSVVGIIFLQQKYFWYHLAPLFILLTPMAALGILALLDHIRLPVLRIPAIRTAALVGACFFSSFVTYNFHIPAAYFSGIFSGNSGRMAVEDALYPGPGNGVVAQRAVLHYLENPQNAAERVEVCSFDPMLRLHLEQQPASSFSVPTALACDTCWGTLPPSQFTDYQVQWRAAYMDSLRRLQPRFIIIGRTTEFWYLRDPYAEFLRFLPGFDSLLKSNYQYDTAFGTYQIFRNRQEK